MFRPDLPKIDLTQYGEPDRTLHVAWIASEANAIHDAALVTELANLIDRKKLPIFIHAMGKVESMFPKPVAACVVLHGPLSYMELPRYLASMDAGLVLYNIRYDGGSPLKLFDYLASGCVPFCSPGQGVETVLNGSGAGYVRSWTAETLLDALESLRREESALTRAAIKGRTLIETTYNWRTIAEKTDRIIRDSVARRIGASELRAERESGSP
jgi:glycosyltransferase involved in cell wall biosynthesis